MPHSFPTLRSSDLDQVAVVVAGEVGVDGVGEAALLAHLLDQARGEAATAEDVVHDIGGVVVWIVARDDFLAERHHRLRSEENTSELHSLMRISYAVLCLKKKNKNKQENTQL